VIEVHLDDDSLDNLVAGVVRQTRPDWQDVSARVNRPKQRLELSFSLLQTVIPGTWVTSPRRLTFDFRVGLVAGPAFGGQGATLAFELLQAGPRFVPGWARSVLGGAGDLVSRFVTGGLGALDWVVRQTVGAWQKVLPFQLGPRPNTVSLAFSSLPAPWRERLEPLSIVELKVPGEENGADVVVRWEGGAVWPV
jgi:hypothetical protein